MNEMNLVRDLLKEPPPPAAHVSADALARLDAEISGDGRRSRAHRVRRPRLTLGLPLGLVAAAAATAVAISSTGQGGGTAVPTSPPAPPGGGASHQDVGAMARIPDRQVLLVAAGAAERAPAADGTYWRVRSIRELRIPGRSAADHKRLEVSWYGKDGWYWGGTRVLSGENAGKAGLRKERAPRPFELSDQMFTLRQIISLPRDPEGLERWARGIAEKISPSWREQDVDSFVGSLLCSLLVQAPARPATRSAAFRALAKRTDVKVGGMVKDGTGRQGRAFTFEGTRYVLDPTTSILLSETVRGPKNLEVTYLDVGWTNEKPAPPAAP